MVDVRDLPSAMFPLAGFSLLRVVYNALMSWMTNHILKKASRIGTVTPWLKQELISDFNCSPTRITVIRNGSATRLFAKAFVVKKEFDLVYSGMLVSPIRNPKAMVKYLRYLTDLYPSLRVLVISDLTGLVGREFLEEARREDLLNHLTLEGLVPSEELPERLGRARLGFTSLKPGVYSYRGVASAKVYEYLAAGLPVVGLLDGEFYLEEGWLVTDNQAGILHQGPERLAAETAALLKDPARLRKMSKRARKVGERFDRKRLAEEYYYKVILSAWKEFNATR